MKKPKNKLYVVRKYIPAASAGAAIRKEKKVQVHEVFLKDDWAPQNKIETYAVGFEADFPEEDEEDEEFD